MTITKKELTDSLSEKLGFSKMKASALVESFFEEIKNSLVTGEPVKLSGFGSFKLRDKGARPGRNPKTREDTLITPRRVVTFRASPKLKEEILISNRELLRKLQDKE